jgi:hypothetical protein
MHFLLLNINWKYCNLIFFITYPFNNLLTQERDQMLKQIFIYHQWKSFIRNGKWRRNPLSKFILLIMFSFFLSWLLLIGFNIDKILSETNSNPIKTFNSFLISYMLGDLLIRLFFQSLPSAYFIPYLRFSIRNTKLVNLMIIRSLWNWFNIIPWFIVIPFSAKVLFKEVGLIIVIQYLLAIFNLILINNFLTILIQYLIRKRKIYYFIPICILVLINFLPKIGMSLKNISEFFGDQLTSLNPVIFSLLLTFLVFLICLVRYALLSCFYFDEPIYRNRKIYIYSSPIYLNIFSNLGDVGNYMSLEIKLLLRNKRPKQTLGIYPVFPIYLIISLLINNTNPFITLLMLTFTYGLLSILYGQYIFSWESTFFDFIMTRKLNFSKYVKAKYYLMILFSSVIFILLIPIFLLFFKTYIISLFSMFIFSIGTINFIILLSGIFNDGRIILNESFFFNYQGLNSNQLILPLIVFIIPIGIYTSLNLITNDFLANILLIVIGLVFLIFHNWWIKSIILKIFEKRKYRNLEGFRNLMT